MEQQQSVSEEEEGMLFWPLLSCRCCSAPTRTASFCFFESKLQRAETHSHSAHGATGFTTTPSAGFDRTYCTDLCLPSWSSCSATPNGWTGQRANIGLPIHPCVAASFRPLEVKLQCFCAFQPLLLCGRHLLILLENVPLLTVEASAPISVLRNQCFFRNDCCLWRQL